MEPWKRGDISSHLEIIAKRIGDIESAISAARSEKETVEQIRKSLFEDEDTARRILDSAAREELKPAFDEQFINSAKELINTIRELASVDLWVLSGKQGEVRAAKKKLEVLQKQVSEAKAKYDRAKALDELRQTVILKASASLSEFAQPGSRGRLSGDVSSDERGQLTGAQNILGQLENSVDAVMDREEKRTLIGQLPHRSGGWAFRFDIDKITDEEHARAVRSVDGSQAKYELVVACRNRCSEFVISTFESGGIQSKRIPWNIDVGAGAYQTIRLRIDSNPAFTAQLFMRGYGNQGQAELGTEFQNLIHSSRLVLADVFPDDQVEVPTAYPMEFKRLCELLSKQPAARAHH